MKKKLIPGSGFKIKVLLFLILLFLKNNLYKKVILLKPTNKDDN